MEQNRIGYLDAAKGIAIICIVIGHAYSYYVGNGNCVIPYLYSFHVPIFFVISGILCANRGTIHVDLIKKFRELIVPYFFWGTTYQICLGFLAVIGGESFQQQLSDRVITVISLSSGAMWFLPTMFFATIFFKLSIKISYKVIRWTICILAFVLGAIAPHYSVVMETIWRGLIGFSFISVGYYGASVFTRRVNWYIWFLLLFVDVGLINVFGTANLASRSFGFIPLYLIVSFLGSWLCITACYYLESRKANHIYQMIERIGKNSIVFLCTHQILIAFLQLVDYKFLDYGIQRTGEFEGVILVAIVVVAIYLIMPLLLRFLGWSFGLQHVKNEDM
ncbi:MAG: acyltransferase family protein [Erysipelotrichaceae bacterium]|nr:acyltransferase family protein [Erysipelotrichaceae bacterium]